MTPINETIGAAIAESIESNEGRFSLEVEIDGNTVVEDCAVYTYDEDGEETENDIRPDIAAIERYAERWAA